MSDYEGRQKNFDEYINQKINEILELNIPVEKKENLYSLLGETIKSQDEHMQNYLLREKSIRKLAESEKKLEVILAENSSKMKSIAENMEQISAVLEQKGKPLN